MLTIEELIASETAKAKEYKAQADFGWDYFTHKKLSYLEQGRNALCAERHNQIAELLRELMERRKAPEIIRCKECKLNKTPLCAMSFQQECEWNEDDDYCSWAERGTE